MNIVYSPLIIIMMMIMLLLGFSIAAVGNAANPDEPAQEGFGYASAACEANLRSILETSLTNVALQLCLPGNNASTTWCYFFRHLL